MSKTHHNPGPVDAQPGLLEHEPLPPHAEFHAAKGARVSQSGGLTVVDYRPETIPLPEPHPLFCERCGFVHARPSGTGCMREPLITAPVGGVADCVPQRTATFRYDDDSGEWVFVSWTDEALARTQPSRDRLFRCMGCGNSWTDGDDSTCDCDRPDEQWREHFVRTFTPEEAAAAFASLIAALDDHAKLDPFCPLHVYTQDYMGPGASLRKLDYLDGPATDARVEAARQALTKLAVIADGRA
jgi:hypothetical protein